MGLLDAVIDWIANLTGQAVGYVGEKAGEKLAETRPLETYQSARRSHREMAELNSLSKRLSHYAPQAEQVCQRVCQAGLWDGIQAPLVKPSLALGRALLTYEGYFPPPPIDPQQPLSTAELWELTNTAKRQLEFYEKEALRAELGDTLRKYLYNLLDELPTLPETAEGEGEGFRASLIDLHRSPAQAIQALYRITFQTSTAQVRFNRLSKTLQRNICIASGVDPENPNESNKDPVFPEQATDKSPAELAAVYLANTPFSELLSREMSYSIPLKARFEHMHVVGGSGHGKTQLLQSFILKDLEKLREGQGSVIVIDSQGDMLKNILNLSLVGEMAERVVFIDPNDIEHPPALNLFDFGLSRLSRYNAVEREKLVNGAVALYEYVFGALLGAELTQRQGVIFRYLARLMMGVPNGTIRTLMEFMEEPEAVRPYLEKLDPTSQHFFETQFFSKKFDDTRQQILTRLWGILSNSVLERMFASEKNKLDLFDAMNRGSVILINTAKDLLKQEGCEILGRFFIALICQAAQERAGIPEEKRRATFVYIDEAHDYFDESMENLLTQARKYKVGLVLAHQNLEQFETRLHGAVMANTSIKMVGGLSGKDTAYFAREMRTEAEFLQSMRKHQAHTEFACFIRNVIDHPVRVSIPFGQMEKRPRASEREREALLALNRSRYCGGAEEPAPAVVKETEEQEPAGLTVSKHEML